MESEEKILFYTNKWYVFDNFSSFAITWEGFVWPTVEHAYQAAKFHDTECIRVVREAKSAHEAKKLAHQESFEKFKRLDWDDVKVSIMRELVKQKLEEHPYVKKKLLETGDMEIIEDSPVDSFWGRGPDWKGQNMLGKLWMELRGELRAQSV